MDSLPEDMTMRTLIKGMIAEEVPQSIVRPGTRSRLQKRTSTPKKLPNVSVQPSPTMVLRSQIKAKLRCLQGDTAIKGTAESSKKHSAGKKSPALRKAKNVETIPQEALDDYTPRKLLKKFMQTELESSLVTVVNPEMKMSVQKKSQPKIKLSSGSNDSFGLSVPAEDTTEQNLPTDHKVWKQKKISVSEFAKATQQRLQQSAEPQESEQMEQCERSSRLPDVSTIVGLINPNFEESTTKPVLCRRPINRKVINEDDFEEGVHNYLEQEKEPEEIERSGPFEKTTGLTDISRIVGSINFDTDESVSKPILSRRPRRDKLISEDDFEEGVLFYLQQTKEKPHPEVQETSSDSTGKEKSSANIQQDELATTELYTSPWPTKSNGIEAVSAGTQEMKNEFGLNSGLDLEKQTGLSVPAEEESVKMAYTGRASSHRLIKEKSLIDTDHQMEYSAEKLTEDLHMGEESMDHGIQTQGGPKEHQTEAGGSESVVVTQYSERSKLGGDEKESANDGEYQADYQELKMARSAEQNLTMQGGQASATLWHSDGVDADEGVLVDKMGDRVANEEVNDERMEVERTEGDEVVERVEGEEVDDERVEGEEVVDERVEGEEVVDEQVEGDEVDDERVEGDEVDDERVEGDEVDDGVEGDEVDDERVDGDERMEGDEVEDEEVEPDEVDEREELIDDSQNEEDDSKVRPIFQQSDKIFRSSPLLTTPHFLKNLGSKAQKPLRKIKQNPKKPTQTRKRTILPSSFVKSVFTHYAKMRVKKATFTAVEQCLELYFKQLCDDVDVYSKHAKRKTIEKDDLELLMKRQGFVTAKTPLNVLIEHHLPMECREKLIPMAVSGSKIIPKK
ncbi:centromere protein T [Heterodontus francisci]|uniref:centromere protein T n=1 Tax=Heterodontus francisci TaxID=7792 RepID=UPI00355C78D3